MGKGENGKEGKFTYLTCFCDTVMTTKIKERHEEESSFIINFLQRYFFTVELIRLSDVCIDQTEDFKDRT